MQWKPLIQIVMKLFHIQYQLVQQLYNSICQNNGYHYIMREAALWQYGLWSFQTGGTKLERFLPKNPHTQRKLSNFENWVNGDLSKKCQKLSKSVSISFSLKNINLEAHFLLLTFFDNINF